MLAGCAGDATTPGTVEIVTGSTDDTGGAGRSLPPAAPGHTPTAVPGVASCAELPQQPPDGAEIDRLPQLRLPCLTPGPDVDLSALGGRPVLVNLWASWCGPCREEMPVLQAPYERYGGDVQFLGVDTKDATEPAAAFLAEVGVTYPQVVDLEGDVLAHLRLPGLPVTVLLDAEGRVVDQHIGALNTASMEDLLGTVQ
jgi:thiol-disulfide isomerase/thioredoxin